MLGEVQARPHYIATPEAIAPRNTDFLKSHGYTFFFAEEDGRTLRRALRKKNFSVIRVVVPFSPLFYWGGGVHTCGMMMCVARSQIASIALYGMMTSMM